MTAGPFLRAFFEAQLSVANLLNCEFMGDKPTIAPEMHSDYRGVDESVGTVPKTCQIPLQSANTFFPKKFPRMLLIFGASFFRFLPPRLQMARLANRPAQGRKDCPRWLKYMGILVCHGSSSSNPSSSPPPPVVNSSHHPNDGSPHLPLHFSATADGFWIQRQLAQQLDLRLRFWSEPIHLPIPSFPEPSAPRPSLLPSSESLPSDGSES